MKKPKPPTADLAAVVRILDKTTRVMQTMSMRIDVLAFGERQIHQRLHRLERRFRAKKEQP